MPDVKTEAMVLDHMAATLRQHGKLSHHWPGWTQAKIRALERAARELPVQVLAEQGVLDIGIGEQAVMEGFLTGDVRYRAVEGCEAIASAAIERMSREAWADIDWDLERRTFSEFDGLDYVDDPPAIVVALDVLYHIPEDAVYESLRRQLFECGASYVVLSHPREGAPAGPAGLKVGQAGFAWLPRRWEDPEGWEVIHSEDSTGANSPSAQRVIVLRRVR